MKTQKDRASSLVHSNLKGIQVGNNLKGDVKISESCMHVDHDQVA
ncbi:hypothetical protein GJV44_00238 [Candidatus Vallotia cooleyia]|nr:hypothetical protein GJV44_00238 [Candidatus Vallotia cooleyia]